MSSPVTHGLSGLSFGTPTSSGYVVQSLDTSSKAGVVAEVFDETGCRVHSRYDDITTEVTFEAIIQGATLPTPGAVFTVNSQAYETISVDKKWSNKEFTRCSIKGKVSANITP